MTAIHLSVYFLYWDHLLLSLCTCLCYFLQIGPTQFIVGTAHAYLRIYDTRAAAAPCAVLDTNVQHGNTITSVAAPPGCPTVVLAGMGLNGVYALDRRKGGTVGRLEKTSIVGSVADIACHPDQPVSCITGPGRCGTLHTCHPHASAAFQPAASRSIQLAVSPLLQQTDLQVCDGP